MGFGFNEIGKCLSITIDLDVKGKSYRQAKEYYELFSIC